MKLLEDHNSQPVRDLVIIAGQEFLKGRSGERFDIGSVREKVRKTLERHGMLTKLNKYRVAVLRTGYAIKIFEVYALNEAHAKERVTELWGDPEYTEHKSAFSIQRIIKLP